MKKNLYRFSVVFALALVALTSPSILSAQETEIQQEAVSLSGQISESAAGGYVLVEQESGKEIVLAGSAALSEYVGSSVTVTGYWIEAGESFEVASVEPA